MSTGDLRAEYDVLSEVASGFGQEQQRIKQIVQKLGRQTEVLQQTWLGRGADTFQREMATSILPEFRRLEAALAAAGSTTSKVSKIFSDAELEAASYIQLKGKGVESSVKPAEAAGGGPDSAGRQGGGGGGPGGEQPDTPQYGKIIDKADMPELAAFFSQWTGDLHEMGQQALLDKYLNDPKLVEVQKDIIRDLVQRAQTDAPPLTAKEFYDLVNQHVGDPGTSMLVAHNILKEFARPTSATLDDPSVKPEDVSKIAWSRNENSPAGTVEYEMAGEKFSIDTTSLHPNALAEYNGHPSAFYMMFDKNQFGTTDAGDWYHYYANSTMAYYGAAGRLTGDVGAGTDYQSGLGMVMRSISNQQSSMGENFWPNDAYKGWRYANAMSFMEGGRYGDTNAEVLRESQIHRQGALLGLEAAGVTPPTNWSWNVAEAGSLRPNNPNDWIPDSWDDPKESYIDVITGLGDDTQTRLDSQGNVIK